MWFSKYKKTDFQAGFLLEDTQPFLESKAYFAIPEFVAPRKIDNRDMCLRSSNQGNLPHCAGFATAGYIEFFNWRTKHYPEQIDGSIIYNEAKKIDGLPNVNGTNLRSASQAALNLGLIKGEYKQVGRTINDVKFALHQYSIVIAGFNITSEWNIVEKATGRISKSDNPIQRGGHAVDIVGFSDADNGFYIQNSWGEDEWGLYGFAILSYEQFQKQLMDACIIIPSLAS